MAIKGAASKEAFFNTLKQTFPDGFFYNGGKEFRVPFKEDGAEVQLKIAVTCAKENVERPSADVTATTAVSQNKVIPESSATVKSSSDVITEEEKATIQNLLNAINEEE